MKIEKVKSVSIIVPAYNEEKGVSKQISDILEIMDTTEYDYEFILINDGSTDHTLDEIQKHEIVIINSPYNRGYGASLKAGITKAKFEMILITDADGTYPTKFIPDLIHKMDAYDMVVGARTGKNVVMPWARKPAKWFLRILASYLAGAKIPDLNSGLRVMKKSIVLKFFHILPLGFSFTTTITLAMLCNGYLVYFLPIDYYKRKGNSKINPSHAYHFLLLVLRTIIYFNPLKIFLPLGAFFILIGFLKLFLFDIADGDLSETAAMSFLAAFIIWAIGLLSDQIARVGLGNRK